MGMRAASAAATAVLPTPVGPTTTGVRSLESGAAEPALKLFLGKLNHRWPTMHIVRRQRGGQQPHDQLPHFAHVERLTGFDGGAARVGRRETLQAVLPAAEPAAGEIGDQLLETARRFEPRVGVRCRMHNDAATGERLDLVADAREQLAMRFDGIELGRREVERQRQEQSLRRRAVARQLAHDVFVEDSFMGGVLVDYRYTGIGLEKDIRIEHLHQRRYRVSAIGYRVIRAEEFE